jgi:hypothetical protein
LTLTPVVRPRGKTQGRRSGLHSILTSSQFDRALSRSRTPNFMVSFKRPQVRRCRGSYELPPEHRRLRFSFQINDVKDPSGFPNPPFNARWRRGAAYLDAPKLLSTGSFELSVPSPVTRKSERKTRYGAAFGCPPPERCESIGAGEDRFGSGGSQGRFDPSFPRPEGLPR